jgi:two-component system response regulator ResD
LDWGSSGYAEIAWRKENTLREAAKFYDWLVDLNNLRIFRHHGILVIDTDSNIRRLIRRSLNRFGAQVYQASNSEEGLAKYLEHRPDLVIIDVSLPGSDGWAACQSIRQISLVPILMLIGPQSDQDTLRGMDCGANEFVRKPFDTNVLLARTGSLLQQVGIPRGQYRFA